MLKSPTHPTHRKSSWASTLTTDLTPYSDYKFSYNLYINFLVLLSNSQTTQPPPNQPTNRKSSWTPNIITASTTTSIKTLILAWALLS